MVAMATINFSLLELHVAAIQGRATINCMYWTHVQGSSSRLVIGKAE